MTTTRTLAPASLTAAIGDHCEFPRCAGHLPAIHRFQGRDLCGYHSPFDSDKYIFDSEIIDDLPIITDPMIIDSPISEFEIMESLPAHITFRVWVSSDGSQRVSFPTHTNMLLICTSLCARGFLTELTLTSKYCLRIKRLTR